jgi:hypothetical protein
MPRGTRPPLPTAAWKWSAEVASSTTEHIIRDAVGDLAAELVLRTEDGSIQQMFTTDQIQSWTFDGKKVVPRV